MNGRARRRRGSAASSASRPRGSRSASRKSRRYRMIARARPKDAAALLVDDQIDVALAIALLDVRKAMPLVRQRPQRLRQQAQLLDAHRQLAGLGPEQRAFGADDVADVPALERLVRLAERVAAAGTAGSGRCGPAIFAKLALPMTRLSIMRPPTCTRRGFASSHSRRARRRPSCSSPASASRRKSFGNALRPAARSSASFARRSAISLFSSGGRFGRRSLPWTVSSSVLPAFRARLRMNSSRSPSSTACVSPLSTPVRRSLMRDWSST